MCAPLRVNADPVRALCVVGQPIGDIGGVVRGRWVFLISSTITLAIAGNALGESGDTTTAATPQSKQALKQATADRIFHPEAKLVEAMPRSTPLVETYIQNLKPAAALGALPSSDQYFLGRLVLDKRGLSDKAYEKNKAG